MSDTEQKAQAMILEVLADWGCEPSTTTGHEVANAITEALCRAIEQNEALREKLS